MKKKRFLAVMLAFVALMYLPSCQFFSDDDDDDDETPAATYYSVTFDGNGGSFSLTIAPQSVESGKSTVLKTVSALGLTRDNYTFAHWNTVADDSGTAYNDGASVTLSSDLTLFAIWTQEAKIYTINSKVYTVIGGVVTTKTESGETVTVGSEEYGIVNISADNMKITIYADGSITGVVTDGDTEKTYSGTLSDDGSETKLTNTSDSSDTLTVTTETEEQTAEEVSGAETLEYYVGSSRDYKTIGAAVSAINAVAKSANSYVILIDGTVSGAASIENLTGASLTIKGAHENTNGYTDILTLATGEADSVLTISTTTPVTIENLKITGGTGKEVETQIRGGGMYIESLANVTLGIGALISENTAGFAGGVCNYGMLTIAGGEISYNTTTASNGYGGGLRNFGTMTMTSGSISNNTATNDGGGVYGGTFTMYGGTVSDNTANGSGGGVCVTKFILEGGTISSNKMTESTESGGGVRVNSSAEFVMNGGVIKNNTSVNSGGGVAFAGLFTMTGGEISENTATNDGGGVNCDNSFVMTGGEISGNSGKNGGGVKIAGNGSLALRGGTISNNTATDNGGGIYNGSILTFYKGEISGNKATNKGGGLFIAYTQNTNMNGSARISGNSAKLGGGVFIDQATFGMSGTSSICSNTATTGKGIYCQIYDKGSFSIEGSAYVKTDNDVYLRSTSAHVRIRKDLKNHEVNNEGYVAVITPYSYTEGLNILYYDNDHGRSSSATTTLEDEYTKFKLSDETYTIASDGTL